MMKCIAVVALAALLAGSCSDPAATAPPPGSVSKAPKLDFLGGFDVVLTMDEAGVLHRRIGGGEYPKDDELEKAIREAHALSVKSGKPDAPVRIVAGRGIPWSDIIAVVNIAKRCGIEHIEFDADGQPATPK